jgi:hypothetical protein
MENRDRDRDRNSNSTDRDDIDRNMPERKGRVESDSNADFGENIGRSEKWDDEPSRRKEGSTEGDGRLGDGRSDVGRTGSYSNNEH